MAASCIAWTGNDRIGEKLSLEEYLQVDHAAMRFTSQPVDSLEELILKKTGQRRRVVVTTRSYALLPHLVVETNWIATVHRRLAETIKNYLPIRILPDAKGFTSDLRGSLLPIPIVCRINFPSRDL